MLLLEHWMVSRFGNSNNTELQEVHLNEIIQFDFAEVIRQVILAFYMHSCS
jgi:hypothetical protein